MGDSKGAKEDTETESVGAVSRGKGINAKGQWEGQRWRESCEWV